jgi:uncharacterized membrane protein YfcA
LTVSSTALGLLVLTAFGAGIIDAVAGGGGLVTVPALIAAGLPPQIAIATNKGQSVFGSCAALIRFARGGLVDRDRARLCFPAGLLGSAAGALLLLLVRPDVLRPIVIGLLLFAAAFVGLRRGPPRVTARVRPERARIAATIIALVLGAYDGFFGPGAGTFLIVAFVSILGDGLARASGEAKVVNFASNLAGLVVFASHGVVIWSVALPMAAAQLAAGTLGAHLAIRRGDVFVRRILLLVVFALVVKLARDFFVAP